ncbi:caspase family protein [Terrimonas sp. NA20]|uniref:Caspase family protein n=1 Tax=Terrimonas ginsenosidimutans TaxID=2908004 RepID=A0ABS9KK85_9BACT|nr:caspase family protein [Terrimonas ginsenosidimutans]MCG2612729.1 caspase family protein [Terrimonas ginsenosidimutans]
MPDQPVTDFDITDFFSASKAYFVAVNQYRSNLVSNLVSPQNDAEVLAKMLTAQHGFQVSPVEVPDKNTSLANPLINPGAAEVKDFFSNIKVGKRDRVIIYFAGHGIVSKNDDEPEGYLLAADADPMAPGSYIPMKELRSWLNQLPCEHLLLVLDCCYAGAFKWADRSRSLGAEVPKTIYYERFRQYAQYKAWQLITSSAHDQKSLDIYGLGKREGTADVADHSPFAALLLKALQSGEADLNYGSTGSDGIITASELGFYLKQQIIDELFAKDITGDKQQTPSLSVLTGDTKGEFLFISPYARKTTGGRIILNNRTNRNPYKGLYTYQVSDNKIFYGRDRVLKGWEEDKTWFDGLLKVVEKNPITIVTGPSGIGKSSLVKAGVLSLYKESAVKEMRPGKSPESLLNETLANNPQLQVLLIDQYEELVTVCESPEERKRFEDLLKKLSSKIKMIITVRSDLEFRFASMMEAGTRFPVPPFSREEIREIVTQPAAQEVLEFRSEEGNEEANERFINRIVDEAYLNPGSLPLLSLALSDLYDNREDQFLLETKYNDFGGVNGIIDKMATDQYNQCKTDTEKLYFRQLIFRMLSFESGQMAKRKVYLGDALMYGEGYGELEYTDPAKTASIRNIVERLKNAHLLRSGRELDNRLFIEPSHEALLNSWSLLQEWIKKRGTINEMAESARGQLHQAVAAISADYARELYKNKDYLWVTDPRLQVAEQEISNRLNHKEKRFVEDSQKLKSRQRRRRIRLFSGIGIVILGLGIWGWIMQLRASERARKSEALFLASESDKYGETEKLSMLRKAYDIYKDSSIERKLFDLLNTYDYYNPFAIASLTTKDSIYDFTYAGDRGELAIIGKEQNSNWNFLKDSVSDSGSNRLKTSFKVTADDQQNLFVHNNQSHHSLKISETTLHGSHVDTASDRLYLVVSDSISYAILNLDSSLTITSKKRLPGPHYYNNITYFEETGFFAIDSERVQTLFDYRGDVYQHLPEYMDVMGIHSFKGHIQKLIRYEELNEPVIGLAIDTQSTPKRWTDAMYGAEMPYTDVRTFMLEDSIALLYVNNAPTEGPGGQFTELYSCNFKSGKTRFLFRTDYVFNTLSISSDKRYALGTSETDSLFYIDLKNGNSTALFYPNLEDAQFDGSNDNYYVIAQSTVGYTVALFDSTQTEMTRFSHSSRPVKIEISPDDKFITVLYPGDGLLVWEINPPFTARPWQETLNSETSFSVFDVNNLLVSDPGSFIHIEAASMVGSDISDVYFLGDRAYYKNDNTFTFDRKYFQLPGRDSALEYITWYDSTRRNPLRLIDVTNGAEEKLETDQQKQWALNALTGDHLQLVLENNQVYYTGKNGKKILIDKFDEILYYWNAAYFMRDSSLVHKYSYQDTAVTIFRKGNDPQKPGKPVPSPIDAVNLASADALMKFVKDSTKGDQLAEQIRKLTGVDLKKDSVQEISIKGYRFHFSENGLIIVGTSQIAYFIDQANPLRHDVLPGKGIISAALYKHGNAAILVNRQGVVYRKKTRRYLDWFLQHGYTVPAKTDLAVR